MTVLDDDMATEVFEEHRPLLLGVAYRMLGRVGDADDVVQDAWLRWSTVDHSAVREPRGYLVRIVTRLAIDRFRQVRARPEVYVGPWLPDPLPTEYLGTVADSAEQVVLAESVSFAVLVVLESLSPLERAVFVLREAFAFPYAEIATILDRSEAAVRQLAGRARRHVEERKPRFEVDPEQRRALTERFLAAAVGGDLRGLVDLLAPQARLISDSGGKAKAPRRVIESADKISRFLASVAQQNLPGLQSEFVEINGGPSVYVTAAGRPLYVVQLEIVDGLVRTVYLLANPDKLPWLDRD